MNAWSTIRLCLWEMMEWIDRPREYLRQSQIYIPTCHQQQQQGVNNLQTTPQALQPMHFFLTLTSAMRFFSLTKHCRIQGHDRQLDCPVSTGFMHNLKGMFLVQCMLMILQCTKYVATSHMVDNDDAFTPRCRCVRLWLDARACTCGQCHESCPQYRPICEACITTIKCLRATDLLDQLPENDSNLAA